MQDRAESELYRFDIRVDGVTVARESQREFALRSALGRKASLPQKLVTIHDGRFGRVWSLDQFGHVISRSGT